MIFDYAENTPKTLELEAERLAALVREFGQRVKTIELIDLAYNKLAIVRFQDDGKKKKANTGGAKTMFTSVPARSTLEGGRARPRIEGPQVRHAPSSAKAR